MDFFSSTRLLEWYANSRNAEYFSNSPAPSFHGPSLFYGPSLAPAPAPTFAVFSFGGVVSLAVGIIIGLIAVYLSWSCNSALQYNIALKVFFAIMAYIFGFLYIILYIIMRYDTCAYIQKKGYY
jgi:hypothetical protein